MEDDTQHHDADKSRPIATRPEAIKEEAWRQIADRGPAALSLRAIGRALAVSAPAIYNYYHRRDDLITALIVDAYVDFGRSQEVAIEATDPDHHSAKLDALGMAYREWAVTNPERYQLMFGAPYPGYELPLDEIGPTIGRSLHPLISVLESARRGGALNPLATVPGLISTRIEWLHPTVVAELYGSGDEAVLALATLIWTQVHGAISIELSRCYPPFVTDPMALYRQTVRSIVHSTIKS
jgi:AcrR family transcriptional regulator